MSTTDRDTTYNGWKNYETWNVALWIGDDEGLYRFIRDTGDTIVSYRDLAEVITELNPRTPDGVKWLSDELDYNELDEFLTHLRED